MSLENMTGRRPTTNMLPIDETDFNRSGDLKGPPRRALHGARSPQLFSRAAEWTCL
jgi:hypothetical protein